MKNFYLLVLALFLTTSVFSKTDMISTVVIKSSESGKRIILDVGSDVGLDIGDFAKFYKGKEVIAQGKCIRIDSSKSIWSVTRMNDATKIEANAEINLRTIPSMKLKNVEQIFSFGTKGFGLAYEFTNYSWNKETSEITGNDDSSLNLNVNYNYVFKNRIMVGFGLEYESTSSTTQTDSGETEEKSTETKFDVGIGYNFNKAIHDSWWTRFSLGLGSIKEEATGSDSTNISTTYFKLELGKRFNLDSIKLVNLSYSPSIEFTSATFGNDADDVGLDSATSFALNIVKFDVLF